MSQNFDFTLFRTLVVIVQNPTLNRVSVKFKVLFTVQFPDLVPIPVSVSIPVPVPVSVPVPVILSYLMIASVSIERSFVEKQ